MVGMLFTRQPAECGLDLIDGGACLDAENLEAPRGVPNLCERTFAAIVDADLRIGIVTLSPVPARTFAIRVSSRLEEMTIQDERLTVEVPVVV